MIDKLIVAITWGGGKLNRSQDLAVWGGGRGIERFTAGEGGEEKGRVKH